MNFLKTKPFPELQTTRLALHSPHANHLSAYHRILSCPETSLYSDLPSQPSAKRSAQFFNSMKKLHAQGKGIAWLIELKQSQTIIGAVRIYAIDKKIKCGDIGYELHPDYWNNGYATEALQKVVTHAHRFMHLNRLQACVTGDNKASDLVLLKSGFAYEGEQRQKAWFQERYWDLRLYARLSTDE